MWSGSSKTTVGTVLVVVSAIGLLGAAQFAFADNLVRVAPTSGTITMDAGTTNSQLKFKIVKTDANDPAGDDQNGCNASDGTPAKVRIHISPSVGLTAPDPIIVDHCGNPNTTVPLTATAGGIYEVTATVEDDRTQEPVGSYHLVPFGTVTVTVVDTIPPETTITSGPASPTSNHTAEFEFSANEPSTFECSLDGDPFETCTSPKSYALDEGSYTFQVRATDLSGNTDGTPASYQWEIRDPSIAITSVNPGTALWGVPVIVSGTADLVDLTGLTVTVEWGDGKSDQGIAISGGQWTAPAHTYAASGGIDITAMLMDGTTEMASDTETVTMNKHATSLTLTMPEHVTGSTKFLASGSLFDTSINAEAPGRTVQFSGDSPPDDTMTQGITFDGTLEFVSCDIPSECTDDPAPLNITGNADNVVLHLGVGGNITFPQSTGQAVVYLQDMGGVTSFKYKVIEYPNNPQDCDLTTLVVEAECSSTYDPDFVNKIDTVSGYTTSGGYKVYNGIKAILITEVDGSTASGSIGISAIITRSVDTDPTDQHVINFESQAPTPPFSGPFTVNGGAYHAIGIAQEDPEANLELTATFGEDSLYLEADPVTVTYGVERNTNGFGATFVASGSGTSVTEYACGGLSDSDNDGICDEFELANEILIPGVSSTVSWTFPPGEEPVLGIPDVYYEIDCKSGFCPTAAELTYIKGRFNAQGINMHLMVDQTGIAIDNPLGVWSDADADQNNDFRAIKLNNYGTNAERTQAGGDLGDGKALFTLKSQAVRYLLFVQNIGTAGGGPTGIAEFKGNDAVVAIDSLPVAAADEDETMIGTIMHEIGHNLGLLHGGTDDVNCKPNYISVMNYNRQIPHSKMPVPAINAATGVGWYGDYSLGNFQLKRGTTNVNFDENNLYDGDKLIKSGTWKAFDGTTTISSFRMLWGTPTLNTQVQYTNTGAAIDWDKDVETANDLDQTFDTNFLSVTVGGINLPACTEAPLFSTIQAGGNDYTTMKANIAKFNGASSAFLGVTPAIDGDPNFPPEVDVEIYTAFNSDESYEFLGVANPLNNVAFGEPGIATTKKGNTINVRFNFNDASGTPITGDNISSYPEIEQIVLRVAKVTGSEPPSDDEYFAPDTSTQGQNADFFTWDGSKWSIQWGTKSSLTPLGTYAARIYVVQSTGEGVVLDHNGDGISFLVQLVKN